MKTIGEFISPAKARELVATYVRSLSLPEEDCAIGHLFSLDAFQMLMNFINKHNQIHAGTPEAISGIRIYHGMDASRDFPDKNDLLIMPVRESGDDLYTIYPTDTEGSDTEDNGILGAPFPCPNKC